MHDIKHVRAMLTGIIFECPLGGNPVDCMCHDLRKLPAGEKFAWIRAMSDEDCVALYRKHTHCLEMKVGGGCCAEAAASAAS